MRSERKKLAQVVRVWAKGLLDADPGQAEEEDAEMAEALAAMGLVQVADDAPPPALDVCYLWPCNVPTWRLWQRVQTQWRVGMAGRTGLDYTAVVAFMREVLGMDRKARAESLAALQVMEFAALEVWAEQREREG